MRKIYYIIFSLLILASCRNYLDIPPHGKVIPKTAEEFSALLQDHLKQIEEGRDQYLVPHIDAFKSYDFGGGDNFELVLNTDRYSLAAKYLGQIALQSKPHYQNLYKIIRNCNIVFNNLKERDTEEGKKILAIAYAMRGTAYFNLMRLFCEPPQKGKFSEQLGLPLHKEFNIEAKLKRSSMQELIDLIKSDLQQSISYKLEDKFYIFTEDVTRAILARFYFWTQNWENALIESKVLIAKYPLISGDAYLKMFDLKEGFTGMPLGNQILKSATKHPSPASLNYQLKKLKKIPATAAFVACFDPSERAQDLRYKKIDNKRAYTVKLFFGIRTAELKLIEAESLFHLGNKEEALKSINELRAMRIKNVQPYTMTNIPAKLDIERIKVDCEGKELDPLLALILRERRKELFCEGDRFFELKRNGRPEYSTYDASLRYDVKKYMYTFPLPVDEVKLIPGMIQNEGYVKTN